MESVQIDQLTELELEEKMESVQTDQLTESENLAVFANMCS